METLVFAVPTVDEARKAVTTLKAAGVNQSSIHLVSSGDHDLEILGAEEAVGIEKSDVGNAWKRGALIGGVGGLILALVLLFSTDAVNWLALPGLAILGLGVGALAASLIGVSKVNPAVEAVADDVRAGKIGIMADVEASKRDEIASRIHQDLPGVTVRESSLGGGTASV